MYFEISMIIKEITAVSIIWGADGTTSVYIAGKLNSDLINFLMLTGIILFAIVIIAYLIKKTLNWDWLSRARDTSWTKAQEGEELNNLEFERELNMNKEWSELNKTMQAQIRKNDTYKKGIDT